MKGRKATQFRAGAKFVLKLLKIYSSIKKPNV